MFARALRAARENMDLSDHPAVVRFVVRFTARQGGEHGCILTYTSGRFPFFFFLLCADAGSTDLRMLPTQRPQAPLRNTRGPTDSQWNHRCQIAGAADLHASDLTTVCRRSSTTDGGRSYRSVGAWAASRGQGHPDGPTTRVRTSQWVTDGLMQNHQRRMMMMV